MESLSTLRYDKGFTLVEILIVAALLMVILGLGLFLGLDIYKSYAFGSEEDIIISLLMQSRSQSLNNINEARHGIHFQNSPGLQYIAFECPPSNPGCSSYTQNASDLVINASYGASIDPSNLPIDIIFDQLSGRCITCNQEKTITVSDGTKQYAITINSEGRIDW